MPVFITIMPKIQYLLSKSQNSNGKKKCYAYIIHILHQS